MKYPRCNTWVVGAALLRSPTPVVKTLQLHLPLVALALMMMLPAAPVPADDDKELRVQRREAHKERQQIRNTRSKEVRAARRTFKDFLLDLTREYDDKVRDLDTEHELTRVELEADRDAKIAAAQAEHQKKTSNLLTQPGIQFDDETIAELHKEWKAHSDELFAVKKEFAERRHKEELEIEQRKHELLVERDRQALDEADRLGLTEDYEPILATPIGDGLTDKEKRWNEKQREEVAKLREQNRKLISEVRAGARLREWEMENLQEDFELEWREKRELQELEDGQVFYNTLLMRGQQDGEFDRQALISHVAELTRERELIRIKYDKIRKQNHIKRREERREIQRK